jgi:DNA repair ATPase RecN
MKPISFAAAVSGLLLAAATIQGAQAQSTGDKTITRDELRACMNRERELATQRQSVEAQNRRNGEEFAAVRAEAEELKAEKERLEREPNRTDRFERRVRAYNVKVEAAKAKDAAFRASLDALNQAVVAHNTRCGGISFLPEDKEAILKEREAAAR